MKILYFDTETTGLVDFRAPITAPHQPRMVQLACVLADETGAEISMVKLRVRPDGFEIPEGASKVHGITTALAEQTGIPVGSALLIFAALIDAADILVAFNCEYDRYIIEREDLLDSSAKIPTAWHKKAMLCAMKPMTEICQLPNPNYPGKFKWPKLQEAHVHLFKEPFDGAHDALADVRATARVFRWLVDNGKVSLP